MAGPNIPVGVVFPQTEIGTDPVAMKDFAQAAEALGFAHILAYDHVIGADTTNRPGWSMPYDLDSMFQEPMVLFSYLAAVTTKLRLSTGVIILPQRQTVLFGKQAATLDILSGGRLRTVVGLGWNKVEYDALGYPFEGRAARLDDQVRLLRRLWTERSFSDKGEMHEIVEAGLWPLPPQQPIPLWIGGFSPAAMKRAARIGDGWLPAVGADQAAETMDAFRAEIAAAKRTPSEVPCENIIFCSHYETGERRSPDQLAADIQIWEKVGAASVCIDTTRIGEKGGDAQIALMRKLAEVIGLNPR